MVVFKGTSCRVKSMCSLVEVRSRRASCGRLSRRDGGYIAPRLERICSDCSANRPNSTDRELGQSLVSRSHTVTERCGLALPTGGSWVGRATRWGGRGSKDQQSLRKKEEKTSNTPIRVVQSYKKNTKRGVATEMGQETSSTHSEKEIARRRRVAPKFEHTEKVEELAVDVPDYSHWPCMVQFCRVPAPRDVAAGERRQCGAMQ